MMAILTEDPTLKHVIANERKRCFYCGEEFGVVTVVYWAGDNGRYIFLHLPCAYRLIRGLQMDLRRLQ